MPKIFEGGTSPRESRQIAPDSMVGLSLGICVNDILLGRIREEEVREIITNTNASLEQWDELLDKYKHQYWYKNPDEGEAIARRLLDAGKIRQPRQEGKPLHDTSEGNWIGADQVDEWEKE